MIFTDNNNDVNIIKLITLFNGISEDCIENEFKNFNLLNLYSLESK